MTSRASTPAEHGFPRHDDEVKPAADLVGVLIVDDQMPFRNAARSVIDRLKGFHVVGEAESGEAAVELAAQIAPDLVLMDINMGEMSGIEATRRIVAHNPDLMVVLLSTYDLSDLPPEAPRSGAAAYLPKDDFSARTIRALWESRCEREFTR